MCIELPKSSSQSATIVAGCYVTMVIIIPIVIKIIILKIFQEILKKIGIILSVISCQSVKYGNNIVLSHSA